MSRDLYVTPRVTLPASDLLWVAVRSSGPGGQNVNKVSTKIELRFDLARTRALDPAAKSRLRSLAAGRIDADGRVIVTSQITRSQERNLEDARDKLAGLVAAALTVPKKRKKTRPSRAARTERLEGKRHHSQKKQTRGRVRLDD
jgi:ribosome-associated protein